MNRKAIGIFCSVLMAAGVAATAQTPGPGGNTSGEVVQQSKETTRKVAGEKKVKTKVNTFIGTVTQLDAGKKLKIEDARKKGFSFDLNDSGWTVTVDPAVAVGSKVKVTETKGPDSKTRTVEPYVAKMASRKHKR